MNNFVGRADLASFWVDAGSLLSVSLDDFTRGFGLRDVCQLLDRFYSRLLDSGHVYSVLRF
eukprot:COSAG03_NODE_6472_length_1055_cov_2.006276_1_plen_60_part_01